MHSHYSRLFSHMERKWGKKEREEKKSEGKVPLNKGAYKYTQTYPQTHTLLVVEQRTENNTHIHTHTKKKRRQRKRCEAYG